MSLIPSTTANRFLLQNSATPRTVTTGCRFHLSFGLGSLTKLEILSLSRNELTGEIPTELGGLANLEGLYLNENQLTGPIPSGLGSLAKLQRLSLYDNQLTGPIPSGLGSLAKLQRLSLYDNQLTGPVPTWLGSLTDLEWLYISENQLAGPMPTGLYNLTELTLWGNELSGEIPEELGSLTKLEILSLSRNELTGEIPTELGGLANLEWLYLGDNQLTGPIPSGLGSLAKLQRLSLYDNQLTGPVPTWLGNLTDLQELDLWGNQLTGTIPPELGRLTNLGILALGGNQLTGPIPPELGSLANLQRLSLYDNQLTGTIPTGLGSLANLEELFLSGNQLTGCIPAGIAGVANNDLNQLGLPFCTGARGAPTISAVTPGTGFLTVAWAAPGGPSESATIAYDLRHIESAAGDKAGANWTVVEDVWTTGSGALDYQVSGLTDGTQYDLQVRSVNADGDGPWSATATGTPATWWAIRSFSPASVVPGGELVVTAAAAAGYGASGLVKETLPPGFSYVSSSLPDGAVTVEGREVSFVLFGETDFTYTVTASSTAGSYSFSGILTNSNGEEVPVGGASRITVEAAPPGVSASRSFSPASVAPGGEVVVTINAANYGVGGAVTETLPEGFTYVSSSLPDSQVSVTGQQVRFTLQGDTSFTYTVTAPSVEGCQQLETW